MDEARLCPWVDLTPSGWVGCGHEAADDDWLCHLHRYLWAVWEAARKKRRKEADDVGRGS